MNHNHYFIPYIEQNGVRKPLMADEIEGWILLAHNSGLPGWGLFDCSLAGDDPAPPEWLPVPARLDGLLRSAHGYPPALALMQEQLLLMLDSTPWTLETFAERACSLLVSALGSQPKHGFLLAEAVIDALPLVAGEWYWITGFYPDVDLVQWVDNASLDYAPRCFFALEQSALLHLVPSSQTPWLPSQSPAS